MKFSMFWGINEVMDDTRKPLNINQSRILIKLEGLVHVRGGKSLEKTDFKE